MICSEDIFGTINLYNPSAPKKNCQRIHSVNMTGNERNCGMGHSLRQTGMPRSPQKEVARQEASHLKDVKS